MQERRSVARILLALAAIAAGLGPVILGIGWRAAFCGRDDEGVCSGSGVLSLQIYLALAALIVGVVAFVQIVRFRAFLLWILIEASLIGGWAIYWWLTLD